MLSISIIESKTKEVKSVKSEKKSVKRGKVKISPKSKVNKLLISNRVKSCIASPKVNKKDDNDVDDDDEIEKGDNLEKRMKVKNRISSIIGAFEENIQIEKDTPNKVDVDRKKVVNAFKFMMDSSRGDRTPSPGMKKKKKRLNNKVNLLGANRLERWLKKE